MLSLNGQLVEDVNCPLYAVGLCNAFCHYGHLKKDDENHRNEGHDEKKKELKSSSMSNPPDPNYNGEIKKEKEQIEVIDLVDDDEDDVQVLDHKNPVFDQKTSGFDQKKPDLDQLSDDDIKFSSDEDQDDDEEDSKFEYSTARHDADQVQLKSYQLIRDYNGSFKDKLNMNMNESQKLQQKPESISEATLTNTNSNSKIDENPASSNKRQRVGRMSSVGHIQAFLKKPFQTETDQKPSTSIPATSSSSSSSKSKASSSEVKNVRKEKATDAKEKSNKRKHSSSSQSPSARKKDYDYYHKDRKSGSSKEPLKSLKSKDKKSHHSHHYHHREKDKKKEKEKRSSKVGNSADFDKLLSEIDKIQGENSSDEDNQELLPQKNIYSKISYPDRTKILQRLYDECVKTYTIARDARSHALLEEGHVIVIAKSHKPAGAECLVAKPDFIRVIGGSNDVRNLSGFVSARLEPGEVYCMGQDPWDIIGLACEMTSEGAELARVTVLSLTLGLTPNSNSNHQILYDQYVVKTLHSSETSEKNEESTILQVQSVLLANIRPNSIIIGHTLQSHLLALKLCHNFVIDTAVLFPHTMGLPYKRSLRGLYSEILVKRISGRDSIENARAALDLAFWKIKNSPLPPLLRPHVKTKVSFTVEDTARTTSTTSTTNTNTPKSTHDDQGGEMETDLLWSDLIVLPKGEEIKTKSISESESGGFVQTPGHKFENNDSWTCSDCTFTNYTSSNNTCNYTSCFNCGWNKKWTK